MKIPDLLEFAIEEEVKKYNIKDLKDIALNLIMNLFKVWI